MWDKVQNHGITLEKGKKVADVIIPPLIVADSAFPSTTLAIETLHWSCAKWQNEIF